MDICKFEISKTKMQKNIKVIRQNIIFFIFSNYDLNKKNEFDYLYNLYVGNLRRIKC